MSNKITSLKFTNPRKKKIAFKRSESLKYEIFWNANSDSNSLDISIHDVTPDITGKTINNPQDFDYTINNSDRQVTDINPDEVVVKKTREGIIEAIYQFSVSYNDFKVNADNVITIFDIIDVPTAGTADPIGSIEFFTEADSSLNIRLERPGLESTPDQVLWDKITEHMLYFTEYKNFIDIIICGPDTNPNIKYRGQNFDNQTYARPVSKVRSPFIKSEEYNLIKFATDFYMLAKFGLDTRQLASYTKNTGYRLPYYDLIIDRVQADPNIAKILAVSPQGSSNFPPLPAEGADCDQRAFERLYNPIMIELIWNYWMEQGMLVQTMNVINLHFQNIKTTKYPSPLDRLHTDPLRPLNHILWGYIQDEQHRLSLPRRVGEYDHEYGLALTGRAVPQFNGADTRVKFLEAFHNLLNLSFVYSKESDDTTYIADAFPILTALREVHLLLAEGNHNAYGDLTWTARQEMMMQQYILSRPEMREFLGGRIMVPYPEDWMDRVDTMRHIMNWGATSILHFYELALHGEQVLLSIRYGNWSDATLDRTDAANWAQKYRNSIYRYIHAYRTATGVDLSAEKIQNSNVFALQPAYLMQQRLLEEKPAYRMQQQQILLGRNRKAS